MRRILFDPRASYHALRRAFVRKDPPAGRPPHLGPASTGGSAGEGRGRRSALRPSMSPEGATPVVTVR